MTRHHHDPGLQRDLLSLADALDRRQMLGWLAVAASLPMVGCLDGEGDDTGDTEITGCEPGTTIPPETQGPYPGDGSIGNANALEMSGVVRSDIRPNIGAAGAAEGVLLTLRMRILDANCAPLAGHAVYVWHCDRDGDYSMYTAPSATWLRGVQVTDADGMVTFTTIFPGCYPGRWPHVHFEVYPDLDATSDAANNIVTSQLAFPEGSCDAAYATAGYEASVTALSNVSLSSDGVFADGAEQQIATVTGDATAGFVAELVVPIDA